MTRTRFLKSSPTATTGMLLCLLGLWPATTGCHRAAGQWRCWSVDTQHAPVAVTQKELWFADEVFAWRYDCRTQTVQSIAPLDGRPGIFSTAWSGVGPDGQIALSSRQGILLCPPPAGPVGETSSLDLPKHGPASAGLGGQPLVAEPGRAGRPRLLPRIGTNVPGVMPFDKDGLPCGFSFGRFYRYQDDRWRQIGGEGAAPLTPLIRPLACLPGGRWLLYGWTENNATQTAFHVVDEDLHEIRSLPVQGAWVNSRLICPDGDGVLVLSQVLIANTPAKVGRSWYQVCRISAAEVKVLANNDGDARTRLGIDLKGRGALRLTLLDDPDQGPAGPSQDETGSGLRYRIESTVDGPLGEVAIPPDRYDPQGRPDQNWPTPIRDVNGHLWIGPWRWDAKQWRQAVPPARFPLPTGLYALDRTLVQLDDRAMAWQPLRAEVPLDVTGFDPKDRTGWVVAMDKDQPVIQQVRFDQLGRRTVLRTVRDPAVVGPPAQPPAPSNRPDSWRWEKYVGADGAANYRKVPAAPYTVIPRTPLFRSPDGDWWWVTGMFEGDRIGDYRAVRLLADGQVKSHRAPPAEANRSAAKPWVTEVWLSPPGHVWMRTSAGAYARFDAQADRFVPGEPWDEFSFRLGRQTLSMVMTPGIGRNVRPGGSPLREVQRKRDDQWKPLAEPSGKPVSSLDHCVFGDRMLVRSGLGVMEYDGATDRWILLHHEAGLVPAFGACGRRLMALPGYVLSFDGDPFDVDLPGERRREAAARRLVRLLDAPDRKTRQQAAAQIRESAPLMLDRLTALAADPAAKPAAREQLRSVLADVPPDRRRPRSLFQRMHPGED